MSEVIDEVATTSTKSVSESWTLLAILLLFRPPHSLGTYLVMLHASTQRALSVRSCPLSILALFPSSIADFCCEQLTLRHATRRAYGTTGGSSPTPFKDGAKDLAADTKSNSNLIIFGGLAAVGGTAVWWTWAEKSGTSLSSDCPNLTSWTLTFPIPLSFLLASPLLPFVSRRRHPSRQ